MAPLSRGGVPSSWGCCGLTSVKRGVSAPVSGDSYTLFYGIVTSPEGVPPFCPPFRRGSRGPPMA